MSEFFIPAKGASGGIAIGNILPYDAEHTLVRRRLSKGEIPYELKRVQTAFTLALQNIQKIPHPILASERSLLADKAIQKWTLEKIVAKRINAEWALRMGIGHFQKQVSRPEEIRAVFSKVLEELLLKNPLQGLPSYKAKKAILMAPYLTPAAVAHLSRQNILGWITSAGGENSHSLILARNLNIPALCGIAREDLKKLKPRTPVILDGFEKRLVVRPSKRRLQACRELAEKHLLLEKLLLKSAQEPCATLDGVPIRVEANAELPQEIPSLLKYGAEGIGLFRTEPLFWNPQSPPSFEEQTKLYETLLCAMRGRPVTIRTMDIGGEAWLKIPECNPALGLRGLRFGLKEIALLRTQLKAILKSSTKGNARILLPMVTSLEEFEAFQELRRSVEAELRRKKIPFREKIPLGVTIEVPAAGLIAEVFARHADFLNIGSNDLLQYTLAVDRDNEHLANLYSPFHPAFWKLIRQIAEAALGQKKSLCLCGEIGGDPLFLPVLIGLGIRCFSMAARGIPKAKKLIRSLSAAECAGKTGPFFALERACDVEKALRTNF